MNAHAPREPDLLSRLPADRCDRWQRGEPVRVEEYPGRHPELEELPEHFLRLVYAEVLLRERRGETPALVEYLARFPRIAGALEVQWRLHELMRGATGPLAPS